MTSDVSAGSERRRADVLGLLPRWFRRSGKALMLSVLALTVAVGAYVGFAAVRHSQPVTLPTPTGVYGVGRVTFDWTDQARTDPLAPRHGIRRELSVWLWYPTASDAAGRRAPYAPGGWGQLHLLGPAETSFGAIRTHARDSAPAADGRFPIVVLEPGLGLAALQYTTLAENLASHGYFVAGLTPTYSANMTVLHGHAVHASRAGNPSALDADNLHTGGAAQRGDRLVDVWAADARFAAAQVARLDGTGTFVHHVDATRTAYVGHSFGGAASLEACRTDPHCAGAVDLDGTQFGSVVQGGLSKPMMILASQDSCVSGTCRPANASDRADQATARALLAASRGPAWCYQIHGAKHVNFSDYSVYYLAAPLRHLLALGTIDGSRALTITNAYVAAFIDYALAGKSPPLLARKSPAYAEVQVQHTPQ